MWRVAIGGIDLVCACFGWAGYLLGVGGNLRCLGTGLYLRLGVVVVSRVLLGF